MGAWYNRKFMYMYTHTCVLSNDRSSARSFLRECPFNALTLQLWKPAGRASELSCQGSQRRKSWGTGLPSHQSRALSKATPQSTSLYECAQVFKRWLPQIKGSACSQIKPILAMEERPSPSETVFYPLICRVTRRAGECFLDVTPGSPHPRMQEGLNKSDCSQECRQAPPHVLCFVFFLPLGGYHQLSCC